MRERRRRRIFQPSPAEDVRREVEGHLAMKVEELVAQGWSPEAARAEAERRFGDRHELESEARAIVARHRRSTRRARRWDALRQDVKFGARQLRAHPGFAIVAILTLALGAGATAAIFSVVDAVLLRPLPYADADRIVTVWEAHPERGDRGVVSRGNYMDWRDQATVFTTLGAWMPGFGYTVAGDRDAEYWIGSQVTPSLFRVLGVDPLLGRVLAEGEEDGIVLSEGLWRRRWGADPSVLGRSVMVERSPYTIVGVMPADFAFPAKSTEFWLPTPLPAQYRQQREAHTLHVAGRLAPGVSVEAADDAMDALALRIAASWPDEMAGWSVNVVPLRAELTGGVRTTLFVLLVAVALVLLMACANVANLLLARATSRGREVAVRVALGAGRARLVRQFLTESTLLAAAGGAFGIALAVALLRSLVLFGPDDVPFLERAQLDVRVLVFTLAVVCATTLLIGLLPALRAARTDVQDWLREQAGRATGGVRQVRTRHAILAAEVALSVILLVGAGLLGRSLRHVQSTDHGYTNEAVVLAWISLPRADYADSPSHVAFFDALVGRLAAAPGVTSVGGTSEPPVLGFDMTRSFELEGRPDAFGSGRDDHPFRLVTPGWFDALDVAVVRGRAFTAADRADAPPVAMVNASLARLLWPDSDPIGTRIRFDPEQPWVEIVGVVEDVRHYELERPDRPAIYAPFAQKTWGWLTWMTVAVRGPAAAGTLAPMLRDAVTAIDRNIPVQRIATLDDVYSDSFARRRFQAILIGMFALAALLLGSIGIYGVTAYGVAQRSNELRVRLALGARRSQVIGMIIATELRTVLVGVAAGLLAAVPAARLASSQLFGVQTLDVPTFLGTSVLLAATAALAAWLAARRAAVGPLRPG